MRYVIITLALIVGAAIFGSGLVTGALVGIRLSEVEPTPTPVVFSYPTGQQVLDELQAYRKSEGLPEFQLSPILCNNISARWQNYYRNNNHQGFREFVDANYPAGMEVAEILVAGSTAKEMVEKWSQSPSHNQGIHDFSKVCVYSSEGVSVAILSN